MKSSSGESLPAGTVPSSHPYKIPQPPSIAKYDSDFPLRKTGNFVLFLASIGISHRSKREINQFFSYFYNFWFNLIDPK